MPFFYNKFLHSTICDTLQIVVSKAVQNYIVPIDKPHNGAASCRIMLHSSQRTICSVLQPAQWKISCYTPAAIDTVLIQF